MWTTATREKYSRSGLRYQSDVTDVEWGVIEPLLPKPRARGRRRGWPVREIVNAIFYVMRSGCPWRLLPGDLPPWSTVYRWFIAWRDAYVFEKINHALVMIDRERVGRGAGRPPSGDPSAMLVHGRRNLPPTLDQRPRGFEPHAAQTKRCALAIAGRAFPARGRTQERRARLLCGVLGSRPSRAGLLRAGAFVPALRPRPRDAASSERFAA